MCVPNRCSLPTTKVRLEGEKKGRREFTECSSFSVEFAGKQSRALRCEVKILERIVRAKTVDKKALCDRRERERNKFKSFPTVEEQFHCKPESTPSIRGVNDSNLFWVKEHSVKQFSFWNKHI
jgi:hypothetical protein